MIKINIIKERTKTYKQNSKQTISMNKTSKSLAAGIMAAGLTMAAFGQGTINFDI